MRPDRNVASEHVMDRVSAGFERIRAVYGEGATAVAQSAAVRLLGPLACRHWSQLTADGFPLEFSFGGGMDAIRITCEVEAPSGPPANRIAAAALLLPLDQETAEVAARTARAPDLRWGAWLGVRASASGEARKLYLEVPASGQSSETEQIERRLGSRLAVDSKRRFLRMIATELAGDRYECYFRVSGLRPWEIRRLLSPFGWEDREKAILGAFEDVYDGALHRRLPSETFGFSYRWKGGVPEAFSLYTFASSMFGGDGRVRECVLRGALRRGWQLEGYDRLSEPLAGRRGPEGVHGMFGISISSDGDPEPRIGLAPPALDRAA